MVKLSTCSPAFRLRRTVIGCGIQGRNCLVLAVSGQSGGWRVRWGLYGELDDPGFVRALRNRVWRRPLWSPPVGSGADQDVAVCGVDLSFRGDDTRAVSQHEVRAALRAQVTARLVQASAPTVMCGIQMRGHDGGRHFAGAAAPRELIAYSYRLWRQQVGIISPHIGSNAAALANLYLALYPPERRQEMPWRLLVLEGLDTSHVLLMDDWRLVDVIAYQMLEDQRLDDVLLESWIQFFHDHHALEAPVVPCVIATDEHAAPYSCEQWHPFGDTGMVVAGPVLAELMQAHADLAPLAFGMALQGG